MKRVILHCKGCDAGIQLWANHDPKLLKTASRIKPLQWVQARTLLRDRPHPKERRVSEPHPEEHREAMRLEG
jgi:hypothetical protein